MARKTSPKIHLRQDTIEWRLLKFVEEAGEVALNVWLPKGYSQSKMLRIVFGLDKKKNFAEQDKIRLKLLASSTLSRLKHKGLVQKVGSRKKVKWQLTALGKNILENPISDMLPEDGRLRIIIFDIPESRKSDRQWLREMIIMSGFLMLQKSAWIGKRPLPDHFFTNLSARGLIEYVHLFEIKEGGTLSNLDWKNVESPSENPRK